MGQNLHEEQQNWAKFQKGNEAAFEQLYNGFFDHLFRYASHYTMDTALIEDILHDFFLQLWKNRSRLTTPSSVKNYLFIAFRRKLIDQLKAAPKYLNEDHLKEIDFQIILDNKETELILAEGQEEIKAKVAAVLSSLTPRQREAIFFRYYESFTYRETAEIMKLSVKATYKLVGRAIEALRKLADGAFLLLIVWLLFTSIR